MKELRSYLMSPPSPDRINYTYAIQLSLFFMLWPPKYASGNTNAMVNLRKKTHIFTKLTIYFTSSEAEIYESIT